jgi:hypothetical protein
MVLHLPHAEGGFGVTFNDVTKDTVFILLLHVLCPGDGKNFQLSTICHKGFGPKIMFFTYGFMTFIGKKFIDYCSLGLRQIAAKLYRSAERNKAYKTIPSLLLPHPSRGRHTSLPPTLSRPSSVQKMRYAGLNFVLQARETETKN